MYWVDLLGSFGSRSLFLSMRPRPKTICTTFFMVPDHSDVRGTTFWLYSIVRNALFQSDIVLCGRTARRRDGWRPVVMSWSLAQLGVGAHWRITLYEILEPSALVSSRVSMIPLNTRPDRKSGKTGDSGTSGSS